MSDHFLPTSAFGNIVTQQQPTQSSTVMIPHNENALLSSKLTMNLTNNNNSSATGDALKLSTGATTNRAVLSDLKSQQKVPQPTPSTSRKRPRQSLQQSQTRSGKKKVSSFSIYSDPSGEISTTTRHAAAAVTSALWNNNNNKHFDYEEEPDRFHKPLEPIPDPPVTCSYWDEENQRYVTDVHYQIQSLNIVPSVARDLCQSSHATPRSSQPLSTLSVNTLSNHSRRYGNNGNNMDGDSLTVKKRSSSPVPSMMLAEPMPVLLDDLSPIDTVDGCDATAASSSSTCLADIPEIANVAAGMDCILSDFDWDNL